MRKWSIASQKLKKLRVALWNFLDVGVSSASSNYTGEREGEKVSEGGTERKRDGEIDRGE